MGNKNEQMISCGELNEYVKDNDFFTHYWEPGKKSSKLALNSEICISEVLISRYFANIKEEQFITLINYKEINKPFEVSFPEGENIIFYNNKYFLITGIIKIKLRAGYYDSFERLRTELYLSFNEIYKNKAKHVILENENGVKMEEIFSDMIRKKDEEFYYGDDLEMKYFRDLLLRLKCYNEQIVFDSERTDFYSDTNNQIQRIFLTPVLANELDVFNDVIISSTYKNISSYKLSRSHLIDEIDISLDLTDNLNNVMSCYLENYRHSLHYIIPIRQYFKINKACPDRVNFLISSLHNVRALFHLKFHVRPISEKKV